MPPHFPSTLLPYSTLFPPFVTQVLGEFEGPSVTYTVKPVSCPIYTDEDTGRNFVSFEDCRPATLTIKVTPRERCLHTHVQFEPQVVSCCHDVGTDETARPTPPPPPHTHTHAPPVSFFPTHSFTHNCHTHSHFFEKQLRSARPTSQPPSTPALSASTASHMEPTFRSPSGAASRSSALFAQQRCVRTHAYSCDCGLPDGGGSGVVVVIVGGESRTCLGREGVNFNSFAALAASASV